MESLQPDSSGDQDEGDSLQSDQGRDRDGGHSGSGGASTGRTGRQELLRYASLSSQVFGSVGVAVFLGIKADKWLRVSFPILAWSLPLLVIVYLTVKLVKESSGKRDGK